MTFIGTSLIYLFINYTTTVKLCYAGRRMNRPWTNLSSCRMVPRLPSAWEKQNFRRTTNDDGDGDGDVP